MKMLTTESKRLSNRDDCHLCGGQLIKIEWRKNYRAVTSDCRPWERFYDINFCSDCRTIQKSGSDEYQRDLNSIYAGYEIYAQAEGCEQKTFDSISGVPVTRSEKILRWLQANIRIESGGRLLDLGCGNGSFLKTFNHNYNNWYLTGIDLDGRHKKTVENIGVNTEYRVGDCTNLDNQYQIITMIHFVEHIINPLPLLTRLHDVLYDDGYLVIQIPDIESSPFDLTIVDHCSHFSRTSIMTLLDRAGYSVYAIERELISKELSVIATKKNRFLEIKHNDYSEFSDLDIAKLRLNWLDELLERYGRLSGKMGVFGSSIGGSWLFANLNFVEFFVDEDEDRIGRAHLGLPIVSPKDIPTASSIVMPMDFSTAQGITMRLRGLLINFNLPPEY